MGRSTVDRRRRLVLNLRHADDAVIRRAAALKQIDIRSFVARAALQEARAVIGGHRLELSRKDSVRVAELLVNPPSPNARLRKAARSLPEARGALRGIRARKPPKKTSA